MFGWTLKAYFLVHCLLIPSYPVPFNQLTIVLLQPTKTKSIGLSNWLVNYQGLNSHLSLEYNDILLVQVGFRLWFRLWTVKRVELLQASGWTLLICFCCCCWLLWNLFWSFGSNKGLKMAAPTTFWSAAWHRNFFLFRVIPVKNRSRNFFLSRNDAYDS